VRDFRDSPWFYPIMFDVAVLLPAVLVFAMDPTQPTTLRVSASVVFVGVNGGVLALVLRRRRRQRQRHLPRHAGAQ
jgi:hypothetical protein